MSLDQLIPPMGDPLRVFVLGQSGSGKTTYVRQSFPHHSRLLVWDWKQEYSQLPAANLSTIAKYVVSEQAFQFRYCPSPTKKLVDQFDALAYLLLHLRRAHDFVLVVDEAHLVCPSQQEEGGLTQLLRLSRAQGIGLVYTSQRPCYVPGSLLGESHYLVLFHLHNRQDVLKIRPYVREDTVLLLPQLKKFEYLEEPLILLD